MIKETMQKLKEQKLRIDKKIAERQRQEEAVKRKARAHALIVIASSIFTESVVAGMKMNLTGYAANLKEKTGKEKLEYLRAGFGKAIEAQEQELKEAAAKEAVAKTDSA